MKRRLFIFITGQYRKFWHSWNNLMETVIIPSIPFFDIYVCVGMDAVWRTPGHLLSHMDRQIFESMLKDEWQKKFPIEHLIMEWIRHDDPYYQKAVTSLEKYKDNGTLHPYWFEYLTFRSGSCLEYAQIARIYEIVTSRYELRDSDLMLRTRADILLRHGIHLNFEPWNSASTKDIFQSLFPTCHYFVDWKEKEGRECSIFPETFHQNEWIITLRKNLVYVMPLKAGRLLSKIAGHYGDWDTEKDNHYWFNAESQFRGCFRHHQFTLWEFSQDKDECVDNFHNLIEDFPIYAIYR